MFPLRILLPCLLLLLAPTGPLQAVAPSPCPGLEITGAYLNRAEHADSRYHLHRVGDRVAATLSTTHSPVQHGAREVTFPLFTVPAAFRPPFPILRTGEGRPMRADGTPDPEQTAFRRFLLRVNPDGVVHYVDDVQGTDVGHLAYTLHTVWGTTPAANDRAVLELLDQAWWPGHTVLARHRGQTQAGSGLHGGAYVTLNAAGRVTALGAPGYRIHGYLSAELGELHRLEDLNLGLNWLTGPVPPALAHLASLETLDLSANLLTGGIPPALGQLRDLDNLDLSHNQLTGGIPPALGQLRDLDDLDLSHNRLSGPLPLLLGQLRDLDDLDLSHNQLSGPFPPQFLQLRDLNDLDLSHNQLSGPFPPQFLQLRDLEYLDLSHNQLSEDFPSALPGDLRDLEYLDLSHNQLIGCLSSAFQTVENIASHGNERGADPLPFCQPTESP